VVGGHDLLGVFVAQLVQREAAAGGHLERFFEQRGRIDLGQAQAAAQMLLGVGRHREAQFGEGFAQPDGGEHILQALARADMEVHVAGGYQRQAAVLAGFADALEQRAIVAAGQQFGGQPGAPLEAFADEAGLGVQGGQARVRRALIRRAECRQRRGDEQRQAARHAVGEVVGQQPVAAFVGPHAGAGDQLRQVAVALAVLGEQHQARGGVGQGVNVPGHRPGGGDARRSGPFGEHLMQGELGSDQQCQAAAARGQVGAYHPGQRAFVGDRQCGITQGLRAFDQFFGMRGATQEGKVADTVQFGVGEHGEAAVGTEAAAVVHE
jgi:hypothetical protein